VQQARAARWRYEAARLQMLYDVRYAWYEFYHWARSVEVVSENVQLVRHLEGVARTKFTAGEASHADVVRAQVELGELEDRLRSLRDLRRPVLATLNAALDRPSDAPLQAPEAIPDLGERFSDDELPALLRLHNPDLLALQAKAQGAEAATAEARARKIPDVMVQGEFVEAGEAAMKNTPDSGRDPVAVTLSLNMPIWQRSYAAGVREARAEHRAAIRKAAERHNELSARLQMAAYRFRDSARKLRLYRDSLLPKARQVMAVTRQAYEAAEADFLDLVDAERTLLEFRLSYERALTDRAQYLAEVEKLVGGELPAMTDPMPVEGGFGATKADEDASGDAHDESPNVETAD
jgi:outer membrane protein TolC